MTYTDTQLIRGTHEEYEGNIPVSSHSGAVVSGLSAVSVTPLAFNRDLSSLTETEHDPAEPETIFSASQCHGVELPDPNNIDGSVEEEDELDPRHLKTRVGLTKNPFSRLVLVGAGSLFVIVMAGILVNGITTKREVTPTVVESAEPEEENILATGEYDVESARLKTEVATAEQTESNAAQINRLQNTRAGVRAANPEAEENAAGGTDQDASLDASQPSTPTSTPTLVTRSVQLPPRPAMPPSVVAAPVEAPSGWNIRELSPVEQWQLAASMGSFGQTNVRPGMVAVTPTVPTVPSVPTVPGVPMVPTVPVATVPPTPTYTPPTRLSTTGTPITQLRASSSVPGMRDQPLVPVLVGSSTEGSLSTNILLASDNSTPSNPGDPNAIKYLISVDSPLLDSNGEVAIPSGAMIVAVVNQFSSGSGAVQLVARSVLVDNREYGLPEGAILIRGKEGGLLEADRQGGTDIFQAVLPALFSGLSEVGSSINQPRSSVSTNDGSTTSSIVTGDSDPAAAFLDGAFGSLSQQLSSQIQQANQNAASRPDVWELEAGEAVQIFVNSTFEM